MERETGEKQHPKGCVTGIVGDGRIHQGGLIPGGVEGRRAFESVSAASSIPGDAADNRKSREPGQETSGVVHERRPDSHPAYRQAYGSLHLPSCAACGAIRRLESTVEQLRAENQKKDALLRDGLHRIKNNLQSINALLAIEVGRMQSEDDVQLIRNVQQRIRSIALVHEAQYLGKEVGVIDFGEYAAKLAQDLSHAYQTGDRVIDVRCDVEQVEVDADIAIPCGLILTELFANALKHAFPDGRNGCVEISVKREDRHGLLLKVSDNGIGLKEGASGDLGTMGLTLVRMLCNQIAGSLEIDREGGTSFAVRCARKSKKAG